MYGYSQAYGSTYANPTANAAALVNAYSQQQTQAQQAASVYPDFGSTATSYGYGSSVGAATTFPTYGQTATAAAHHSYTQAAAQAAAAQTSRLGDAYAAAAQQSAVAAAGLSGLAAFNSLTAAAAPAAAAASAYQTLRSAAQHSTHSQSYLPRVANTASSHTGHSSHGGHIGHTPSQHSSSAYGQSSGSVNRNNTSSTYSGYEQAVYAAASSYLQSKATGQSNMWMNKKNTAAAPPQQRFPHKTRFNGTGPGASGPREVQQFYCEVCKISCAGQLTYKEHLEGQKHKKKEALAKGDEKVTLPKNKVSFRCDLCNVTCTGQDTYNAHVRGAKHVKTLNLCKKLGKPIPQGEPTIIPPAELGGTAAVASANNKIPTVGSTAGKKIVGVPTMNFVGAGKLSTTAGNEEKKAAVAAAVGSAGLDKDTSEQVEALIAAEQNVQPVGEEYVEAQRDATGKLLTYNCKLCDCKFSDPNAKEIHLKGRRHRLQYKLKVNPNLEVDMKPTNKAGRAARMFPVVPRSVPAPYMYAPTPMGLGGYPRPWFGGGPGDRMFDSSDGKHVLAKHAAIYPEDSQLQATEELVVTIEKGLKNVSDYFAERDAASTGNTVKQEPAEPAPNKEADRLLKGVMRVGLLAKQLLLKGDNDVELVVVCAKIPSETLLKEVADLLPSKCESSKPVTVTIDYKAAAMCATVEGQPVKCKITLTSRLVREEGDESSGAADRPADALPTDRCLEALARLRHAKWFQARCTMLQSCQITMRILRDVRRRIPSWSAFDDWTCELLVEKILSSCGVPLSVGDALRRVFEAISAGVLFNCGPGLLDPCEKERVDVLARLTGQQKEDITCSAQHALRLIAFNQLYKILNIERIPNAPRNGDRKRPAAGGVTGDVKKEKKEDGNVVKMEV